MKNIVALYLLDNIKDNKQPSKVYVVQVPV